MRPNPLQRQGSAIGTRRPHFRRLFLELLEQRLVPSTITGLSPNSVNEGSAAFTLGVTGSDFASNSIVLWNGTQLATTVVSSTQLQATVPQSLLTEEGTAAVSVSGGHQNQNSNTVSFTIADAPLSSSGGLAITAGLGQTTVQATATFTDTGGPESLSNYSATISWGDGSSSAGSITGPINGVFTVTASHTYTAIGQFTVSATISHETAPPLVLSSTINVPPTTFGVPAITSLSGPALVEGSGDATLLINGTNFVPGAQVQLNGTSVLTTTFNSSTQLQAVLPGSLRSEETAPEHGNTGPMFINVVETLNGLAVTSGLASFRIAEAPLSAMGGVTVTATAGQSFSGNVATFTDTGGAESSSDYSATISWGDNTTSSGTISGPTNGVFTVSGSHTYGLGGTFTISVTISHETAPSVTVTSTANVAPLPLSATGGLFLYGSAGQPLTGTVATFSGSGASLSSCSATINWGDGTTSTGTITGPGANGVFTVTGTHTYTQQATIVHGLSPFPITVTIMCGTMTATVTDQANISVGPTSGGVSGEIVGFAITGLSGPALVEGSGNGTLLVNGTNFVSGATVQLSGPGMTPTNLTTTFNSSGQLQVTIPASLLKEETAPEHGGPLVVSVSETINGITFTSNVVALQVADAPLSATGGRTVTVTAGQSVTGTVATFTDTGGPEQLSDYSATINWGDNSTSSGTISGPDTNGVFTVSASHTYAVGGTFTISVTINHETAPSVTVTSTANVAAPPLSATGGLFLYGNAGQPLTGTVATFSGSGASLSNCSATINWGDGTTSTGTITGPGANGVFTVTGTHTYTEQATVIHGLSPFPITVTIMCGTMTATVTDQANISVGPLSVSGGATINPVQGQAFTAAVATFTDSRVAQGSASPANYTATIVWGDGNTSAGTIQQNADGSFSVNGSYTYQRAATYEITVAIVDTNGGTAIASGTAKVGNGDEPLTANGLNLTATVSVVQDLTVAQFTDPDPTAHTGGYAVAINWGDGTPVDPGTVTQPGGQGTPFFIDYTHAYDRVGVFTIDVRIFDEAGAVAEVTAVATANAPAAPPAPGRRGFGPLLSVNSAQAVRQQLPDGTLTISSTTSIIPVQPSASSQSGGSADANDLYWRRAGERGMDPSDWTAEPLPLTLLQDQTAF